MSTPTIDDLMASLAVVIDTTRKAKPYDPATNPLGQTTLDQVIEGAGTRKAADLVPTKDKYGWMGDDRLNKVALDSLAARANARQARRKATSRARDARNAQIEAAAASATTPDPVRMAQAWRVVRPLVPTIIRVANTKSAHAARHLGTVTDDVGQTAIMAIAQVLARTDKNLDVLERAALQLADEAERTGKVPGDQAANKVRKAESKARKWLMGLVNNRVRAVLTDLYTEAENLRIENFDILDTVLANVFGTLEDPALAQHLAAKAPSFVASRMPTPGSMHPDVLRVAVMAAITERGLDRLTELLIDEANLNTDGSFKWSARAQDVFCAVAGGEYVWSMVCLATDPSKYSERQDGRDGAAHARAQAARLFVQKQFSFLPWLIASVFQMCEAEPVAWSEGRAIMASAFDPDEFEADGSRKRPGYLVPTLTYASVQEASKVLAESIACVLAGA